MITDFMAERSEELWTLTTWIKDHLDSPISVEDLVLAGEMSTRTLARRVKNLTGYSPLQCVQRGRVEEAGRLLKTTSLSVSMIARRVGFSDRAPLRRLMKRLLNQTPSQLRQVSA